MISPPSHTFILNNGAMRLRYHCVIRAGLKAGLFQIFLRFSNLRNYSHSLLSNVF